MNVVRLIRYQIRHVGTHHRLSKASHAERRVEELFRSKVQENSAPKDDSEWREFRNSVLHSGNHYSQVNVDATILGLCNKFKNMDKGRSYVQFLRRQELQWTPATAGKYLKLFTLAKNEISVNAEQSEEITNICQDIRSKHPILDSTTAEAVIYAICLTPNWRDALSILDEIKDFGTPSHAPFNNIAQAAFRNGDATAAVDVIEDAMKANRLPGVSTMSSWLNYCKSYSGPLEPFLEFVQRHVLQVPELVATDLKSYLEQLDIPVSMSSVSRNKVCSICKTTLDEISIAPEEFQRLQDAFHEKVLIKDNIFIKSTPQEFSDFNKFLKETGPFDCVIDGLNVAYSVGNNKPVNSLSGHILSAMKYFTEANKRVLILGREHMKRWPNFLKRIKSNNGEVFLTENLSEDDPFFLYAALQSGPNCDIFSRDLLRTHAHQLGPELGNIFRKWQRIHQFSYWSPTNGSTSKIFVQPPARYKIETHKNISGFWHVPWTEDVPRHAVNKIPEVPFQVPERWMCFKLKSS